jgi:hypothetical protein
MRNGALDQLPVQTIKLTGIIHVSIGRNAVEVAVCIAPTPAASTLRTIYFSHTFLRRREFFF